MNVPITRTEDTMPYGRIKWIHPLGSCGKLNSYLMMPLNNILDCLKELITESQDFHLLLILTQKDLLQEWLLNSLEITK